ncbi:MAG: T9SS type A sorting domain-containing protein, partial [Bacteroidetes bacterium]|nr:T9SS type A sorting domain-containing protein [Bacteroidota bacterium]
GKLKRIAQIDRTAVPAGQNDTAPTDLGNWESSGILDVSSLFGVTNNNILMVAVTQAHSVSGGPITSNNLTEGGQILFINGNRPCELKLQDTFAVCQGGLIEIKSPLEFQGFQTTSGIVSTLQFTQSGQYTVNAISPNGCVASEVVTVVVNPLPTVELGANGQPICSGNTITLDAGNPGSKYLWSTNATTQTILATAAGTYTVTVTSAAGCTKSDDIVITQGITPVVNIGADKSICQGKVTTLNAGNPGASFAWSNGLTTQSITVSTGGTYSVTVTNTDGCTASDNAAITVNPLPVVNLGPDTTVCTSNLPLTLGVSGAFASYFWSTGDPTPTTQVSASGTYIVTVVDSNGCENKDDIKVTVVVCSATQEQSLTGEMKLYPNPSTGLVNIQLNKFESGEYQLSVTSADGRLVQNQRLVVAGDHASLPLNLTSASKGIYIVKLQSQNGMLVRRLVIQ